MRNRHIVGVLAIGLLVGMPVSGAIGASPVAAPPPALSFCYEASPEP